MDKDLPQEEEGFKTHAFRLDCDTHRPLVQSQRGAEPHCCRSEAVRPKSVLLGLIQYKVGES